MKKPTGKSVGLLICGLTILMIAAGCNYPMPDQPPGITPSPDVVSATSAAESLTANQSPTPEPAPERMLAVCLTQEPASLFPYADSSFAARAVRQAIYDGPIDTVDYRHQAVILEKVPQIADGDAALEPVQVRVGDLVVDAAGSITTLAEGSSYLPSDCRDSSCAAIYSGAEPVSMDQLAVRFSLREGVSWSDGAPLTAQDSLYSFEIARALFPQVRADLIQHTSSYKVLDERSVEWRGLPGYLDPSYQTNFFHPLPQHAWSSLPAEELSTAEVSAQLPLGWGPYIMDEWVAGDHITLTKNETYFRSGEGLPGFDRLVFRFVNGSQEVLAALQAGECDLVNETPADYYEKAALSQAVDAERAAVFYEQDTAWEQLSFSIQPIDPGLPLFFGLKEVRQAAAQCIDRQFIVDTLFPGQSQVMDSYLPAGHPLFNSDAPRYDYDPSAGEAALQAAGWIDLDNDPATPRQAQSVPGVVDGTPFQVELLVLENSERSQVAGIIRDSLAQCGIEVNIRSLGVDELFAPGPDGPVFGRRFNLAQFGWPSSPQPPCELFTSAEIPGPYPEYPKGWGGANASGYSRAEYDQACLRARNSLPDEALHQDSHWQAQSIFGEDLPVLPLFSRYRVILARTDLCGLEPTPSAGSVFWNIEDLNYGDGCP